MERLIELFDTLVDVRDSKGKRHCLSHIMIMSVCAILCGYYDFEDIADFCSAKKEWFGQYIKLWAGIPCARTFRNVFRLLKADDFLKIFLIWIDEIRANQTGNQIIIDGKAVRAATQKCQNGNVPYIVSAYLADIGISIGQVKVEDKSNEITAIPKLLELLEIDGCIITIDAIGTQEKIMEKIKERGGEFVLPLKENQKGAYQEVAEYFKMYITESVLENFRQSKKLREVLQFELEGEPFEIFITRERGHGRKEERIYIKSKNLSWFVNKKWKYTTSLIMAISITDLHGASVRYYVSSIDLLVEELGGIIRKHWQIENNLHWVLDMYFYEDLSRNNRDYSIENLSLLRKIAYNIIKLDTRYDKKNKNGNITKLSTKRIINRYNLYPKEFEELLFKVIPQSVNK